MLWRNLMQCDAIQRNSYEVSPWVAYIVP